MSEEKWFEDSNDFGTAIKNVEAISTGTTYEEGYKLHFRSRTIYFEAGKVEELFKAYVQIKNKYNTLRDNYKKLVSSVTEEQK